jgi:WD40 repeat protein
LVSGSQGGTAKFWNLKDGELLYILTEIHRSAINAIALSSNGEICVTGSEGGTMKVWRKQAAK